MEKLLYLLFHDADQSGDVLRDTLRTDTVPRLHEAGAAHIRPFVHDSGVQGGNLLSRFYPPICAIGTWWLVAV